MRQLVRPVLGIALGAILAGCSHGASGVAPNPGVPTIGQQAFSRAFSYEGAVRPDGTAEACAPARFGEASCFALVRLDTLPVMGVRPDFNPPGLHPADFTAAYKEPSSTGGTGQTIALVDAFDNPNAESDLGVYRAQFGLTACTTNNGCFKKLNQLGKPGPYPRGDQGWGLEEDLDIQMVSAICPNCHIILIEGNSNSFNDLALTVDEAAKLGANAISNSYGGGESGFGENSHYNHPPSIILASSGDNGYRGGPQFPADSQYVVAVGGTRLTKSTNKRGWTEIVWFGAGSGCSAVAPKPTWQLDKGCSKRTIADAAADADPGSGPSMYDSYGYGGWLVVGGTSVASPLLGGIYGLAANESSLNYAQQLYTNELHLFDITMGSNGTCMPKYLCTATGEYSGPVGNGTPHGTGSF